MNGYETVQNSTTTEEIKRSRFITEVRRVKGEEELFAELGAIRKKYSDATHVCYAAVFDKSGLAARFRTTANLRGLPVSRYSKR